MLLIRQAYEATSEQIAAIARDVELAVEHQGMAFYEPACI
uniref:Uncharacterized protein n=1 Tax=Pseudomonas phage PACT201 TaxID=3230130 RepID=A0AAU8GSB4_9VIRU